MASQIIERIQKMIDVNVPIILIPDHDFWRVDEIIGDVAKDKAKTIVEWTPCSGWAMLYNKLPVEGFEKRTLFDGLKCYYESDEEVDKIIVLKDVYDLLNKDRNRSEERTKLISLLHMMAQDRLYLEGTNYTIIIVDDGLQVPDELKKYTSIIEIAPLGDADDEEITQIIESHLKINSFNLDKSTIDELKPNLKGLTRFEIDRIIDIAMSSNGTLNSKEDKDRILAEKKAMVRKEGLLEIVDTPREENVGSGDELDKEIGGLDNLKDYLRQKAKVFHNFSQAQEKGVDAPKGLFLVGFPGCGKSLCAKVTAKLFGCPLLKLDMGSMMGKYVGESESKLRRALRIAEAAAPCVLWIDEIEKGFSGVGGKGDNDVLMRMFGYFLSWMQEKRSLVYVIATANDLEKLPPEMKRKGRFDEIFYVDLPNLEERKRIFEIHLKKGKRGNCLQNVELSDKFLKAFDGYNGADIESIIKEGIEECFIQQLGDSQQNVKLTADALEKIREKTKGIKDLLSEEVYKSTLDTYKAKGYRPATQPSQAQ